MSDVASNWAKVAGIGGIALFGLLVIFRDVIRLKIFPQLRPGHAYRIILVILTFTFVVACGGIVAWYLISDRELKVSEAAFGLLVGKVFAAEVSKGAPTTSEARAERLARLQYLESQMQNIPETYQRFAKALQRAEQLLAKDDVNAQGAQLRHARDALRQGDVLPTVAMLQKVAESSQS